MIVSHVPGTMSTCRSESRAVEVIFAAVAIKARKIVRRAVVDIGDFFVPTRGRRSEVGPEFENRNSDRAAASGNLAWDQDSARAASMAVPTRAWAVIAERMTSAASVTARVHHLFTTIRRHVLLWSSAYYSRR